MNSHALKSDQIKSLLINMTTLVSTIQADFTDLKIRDDKPSSFEQN